MSCAVAMLRIVDIEDGFDENVVLVPRGGKNDVGHDDRNDNSWKTHRATRWRRFRSAVILPSDMRA